MSKKMRLNLDKLKIKSFVTSLTEKEGKGVRGGFITEGEFTACETFCVDCDDTEGSLCQPPPDTPDCSMQCKTNVTCLLPQCTEPQPE